MNVARKSKNYKSARECGLQIEAYERIIAKFPKPNCKERKKEIQKEIETQGEAPALAAINTAEIGVPSWGSLVRQSSLGDPDRKALSNKKNRAMKKMQSAHSLGTALKMPRGSTGVASENQPKASSWGSLLGVGIFGALRKKRATDDDIYRDTIRFVEQPRTHFYSVFTALRHALHKGNTRQLTAEGGLGDYGRRGPLYYTALIGQYCIPFLHERFERPIFDNFVRFRQGCLEMQWEKICYSGRSHEKIQHRPRSAVPSGPAKLIDKLDRREDLEWLSLASTQKRYHLIKNIRVNSEEEAEEIVEDTLAPPGERVSLIDARSY